MRGIINLMTKNDQISFWHCFKITPNKSITYEEVYLLYVYQLQDYLGQTYPDTPANLAKLFKQYPKIYLCHRDDLSQKTEITNLQIKTPFNCDIFVDIDHIEFEQTDSTQITINLNPNQNLPILSDRESVQLIEKAKNVKNISPRTALNFFHSSSKADLFNYVNLLYEQKKFDLILPLIDDLKIRYPRNSQINLVIAKCYEHYHEYDKSIQLYKETLLFSDTPSILIECSKLYMNSDKYLSSLLLNHTLFLDSTNSNVIIQSMLEFLSHKQYNETLDIAFRTQKSIKFLAKLFKRNEELSLHFMEFINNSQIPLHVFSIEGSDLASTFYKNGAVVESLYLCRRIFKMVQAAAETSELFSDPYQSVDDEELENPMSVPKVPPNSLIPSPLENYPYTARLYFTILLNEGHYKRFSEMSQEFVTIMSGFDDDDVNGCYGIQRFFQDYMSIVACKKRVKPMRVAMNQQFDLAQATERQKIIVDCLCLLSNFLFLIGSCNQIISLPNLGLINFKINSKRSYWQIRSMYRFIQPISDILTLLDTSKPSALIIGDENVVLAGYQIISVYQSISQEKMSYYLIPSPIIDISIWKLRKGHKSGQKESFWSKIVAADDYPLIIIELGSVDCEFEIPRLMHKNRFLDVTSAINEIIDIYINLILKIKAKLPNVLILVHPVIPSKESISPIIYEFNLQLKNKTSENQIAFLDLFDKFKVSDVVFKNDSYSKYYTLLRKKLTYQPSTNPK